MLKSQVLSRKGMIYCKKRSAKRLPFERQDAVFDLSPRPSENRPMSSHSIDADIKVKWDEGQSAYSPSTPEELMLIAVDLLVRDRGGDAARSFIEQVLERHAPHEAISIAPGGR